MKAASVVASAPARLLKRLLPALRAQPVLAACIGVLIIGGIVAWGIVQIGSRDRGVVIDLGGPLTFHPLPEMIADLKPSAKRSHHIKLTIVAQIPAQQAPQLAARVVVVVGGVQLRLRELAVAVVAGAAGADR
ncbi:MAG: hypothetical protein MUE49_07870, partial [Rhodospirillales bacterium]|nr:hypothetical protein [Rhodospirillales bacterium]